jgi:hypothetical protein
VTNQTFTVRVLGDQLTEQNETFSVYLSSAFSIFSTLLPGVGTIQDDDAGRLARFAWEVDSPTQHVSRPFSARVTALDATGRRLTNYQGTVAFRAGRNPAQIQHGTGTNLWAYPLGAGFRGSRLQAIYPATNIARAGRISALALDVAALPSQVLGNFTIRLKHTTPAQFESAAWDNTGWTLVYQAHQAFAATGWVTFPFASTFQFNNQSNLLVDFSFASAFPGADGLCRATESGRVRSLLARTDVEYGDPLTWSATNGPAPTPATRVPNVRLAIDIPVPMAPEASDAFVDGIWSGSLSLLDLASPVTLAASDPTGALGFSESLYLVATDTDGDGMPDDWEEQHGFLSGDPADAALDADSDGQVNRDEFLAGTDPRSAASRLRVRGLVVTKSTVRLVFDAVAGKRYQVEAAASLATGGWTPFSTVIQTAEGPCDITLPLSNPAASFFRVRLVP